MNHSFPDLAGQNPAVQDPQTVSADSRRWLTLRSVDSWIRIFQSTLLSLVLPWFFLPSGLAEPGAAVPIEPSVSAPFLNSRWSERDGLPSGSILDLAQSPDGLLWVATRFGLRAFDGARFFLPEGLESLSDEPVQRALFDGNGQIWLCGQGTVYCLKPQPAGGYQKEELPASDVVQDGKGWVWWQNGGVIRGRFGSLEVVLPSRPVPKGESLERLPSGRSGESLARNTAGVGPDSRSPSNRSACPQL